MPKPRHLPKGAGAVRCSLCDAHAAADGKGSPIVLPCVPSCPSLQPDHDPSQKMQHYEAEVYFRDRHETSEIECQAPDWSTAKRMLAEIAARDLLPEGEILRMWQGSELTIITGHG